MEYNQEIGLEQLQANGMLLDTERTQELDTRLSELLDETKLQLHILAKLEDGINLNSPQQVQKLLYTTLELPIRRKRNGNVTTDEDAIVKLLHFVQGELEQKVRTETISNWKAKLWILRLLLKVREYQKLLSTYVRVKAQSDGRVRYSYYTYGTDTLRGSSATYVDGKGWNSQNLPRGGVE
jgi:DNA polymerase I-like protein with 3'-5' exonuclease and polymerase domains